MQFSALLLGLSILTPLAQALHLPPPHPNTTTPLHPRSPPPISLSTWMSHLPPTTPLTALTIPGTHNSLAHPHGRHHLTRFSKCQHHPLSTQLHLGIRFLDLRLRHHRNNFLAYHGPEYLHSSFSDFLHTAAHFLRTHPSEVLLVRVQEAAGRNTSTRSFWGTWTHHRDADAVTAPLFAEFVWDGGCTRVPTVAEARGRVVVIRDFAAPACSAGPWWGSRDVVLVEDSWRAVRAPRKLEAVRGFWAEQVPRLVCALRGEAGCYADLEWGVSERPKLLVTFVSAASWWRQPKAVARRMWGEVWGWLRVMRVAGEGGPLGVVAGDFVTAATTREIVRRNFVGGGAAKGVLVEWEDAKWQEGWKQEEPSEGK